MGQATSDVIAGAGEAGVASPRPPSRTLLVGTATTLAELRRALAAAPGAREVVGAVEADDDAVTSGGEGQARDPEENKIAGSRSRPAQMPSDLTSGERERAVLRRRSRTAPLRSRLVREALEAALEEIRPDAALVCLPLAMAARAREIGRCLDAAGVAWSFIPTLQDQLAGRAAPLLRVDAAPVAATAPAGVSVDPSVLLDRRPHPLDHDAIREVLAGRVVLITGAGGSIGSELARLVAAFDPSRLVLVERSENALFEIDREIARLFPALERAALLHDVTHAPRTLAVVTAHKPAVIFHAAAHKHVPMMEDHPAEAVENNFYGTRSIADAAARSGADRFVMISSDKAVNPSSVMGATKRLAELYIQHLHTRSDTCFSMVRFGNVLGSACSVLPIWTQQLAQGLPITVTHPEMRRYFMTIPEAAGLVLQAAAMSGEVDGAEDQEKSATDGRGSMPHGGGGAAAGPGGTVFLLDMGEPVRVVELARRFVRLHGLEASVDVEIAFTGVRPGEKLYEELAYEGEDMLPTRHAGVRIWRTTPPTPARMRQIARAFDALRGGAGPVEHAWRDASRAAILAAIRAAVPEMVRAAAG